MTVAMDRKLVWRQLSASVSTAILMLLPATVSATAPWPRQALNGSVATTTLAGTGTVPNHARQTCADMACATACSNSWVSWSSASSAYVIANAKFGLTSSLSTLKASQTLIYLPTSNGTLYATCDGFPRFSGLVYPTTATVSHVPATVTTYYATSTSLVRKFASPKPTCVIPQEECLSLRLQWHDEHYLSFPHNDTVGIDPAYWSPDVPETLPHCYAFGVDDIALDPIGCWLQGHYARLLYWPEDDHADDASSCPPDTYGLSFGITQAPVAVESGPVTLVTALTDTAYNITTTVTLISPTAYLSIHDLVATDFEGGFIEPAVPFTVVPIATTDLYSMVIAPPLITNAALSTSAASVIANQEYDKLTDLFGIDWQAKQDYYVTGGPRLPLQTVKVNMADLGKPPPLLSYYFGAAGWYCMNPERNEQYVQRITAALPAGMPCNTVFDQEYKPWIQLPTTLTQISSLSFSGCQVQFGWDPPIALQVAKTIATPTNPNDSGPTTSSKPQQPQSSAPTPGSPAAPPHSSPTPTRLPDQGPPPSQSGKGSSQQNTIPSIPEQSLPPNNDPGSQSQPSNGNGQPKPITVGGVQASPDASDSAIIVGGQTVTPGQTIVLGSGSQATTVVVQTQDGDTVVSVGTSVGTLLPVSQIRGSTLGGSPITADSKSTYSIDGQTLTPGGTIVEDGMTISLASNGQSIVVDGTTEGVGAISGHIATPISTSSKGGKVSSSSAASQGSPSNTSPATGDGTTLEMSQAITVFGMAMLAVLVL